MFHFNLIVFFLLSIYPLHASYPIVSRVSAAPHIPIYLNSIYYSATVHQILSVSFVYRKNWTELGTFPRIPLQQISDPFPEFALILLECLTLWWLPPAETVIFVPLH